MSEGIERRFFISGIDQIRITTSFVEGSGCRDLCVCPLAKGKFWVRCMVFCLFFVLFFCFT